MIFRTSIELSTCISDRSACVKEDRLYASLTVLRTRRLHISILNPQITTQWDASPVLEGGREGKLHSHDWLLL